MATALASRSSEAAPRAPTPVTAPATRSSVMPSFLAFAPPAMRLNGGEPLHAQMRHRLEKSFGADLGSVRVHRNEAAATAFSTRAFAVGPHIVLGSGARANDLGLIAHETAHTIQQGNAPAVQAFTRDGSDQYEVEAQQASAAAARGERFIVRSRTTPRPQFQLGWLRRAAGAVGGAVGDVAGAVAGAVGDVAGAALRFIRDRVNNIPGYSMLSFILRRDPITQQPVERNAVNLIRALMGLWPGGELIFQALQNYGIIQRVGAWLEEQLSTLRAVVGGIRDALDRFLRTLSVADVVHLGDVFERARRIFSEPIDRASSFVRGLARDILGFIRDAVLLPLARLARSTRGYDLLRAVLGQDPISGESVPRNAETLIGGFMKLIGQEEVWNNIKRANAIPRAWAWFRGALNGLLGYVRQIPQLFVSALQRLEISDLILIPRAFSKIARVFGGFIADFLRWAGQQVMTLLEIIFEVVAPAVMPYLRRAMGAFRQIIRNPIGFIGNLVRAGIQGFRQFASNFLTHLRAALIQWLTGTLSGANIYIPQAFTLREIIKFVLSVLGLTWQNIRQKLVRVMGETSVRVLETTFDIVVTLVREGPAAAWEKIREHLTNLREMVMEQIMNFVRDRIVQAAITRLVTSLNPAGAFIQAIIAIYNTIMFFVERFRQIAQVVAAFIDSIAAIARGVIQAAADRVERTMGGLLTLVISFLARLVGLGRVSDAVTNIVNRIRAPIDRALDRVVDWIANQARRLGHAVASRALGGDPNAPPQQRLQNGLREGVTAVNRLSGNRVGIALIRPVLAAIRLRHNMQRLDAEPRNGRWAVVAVVNPTADEMTQKLVDTTTAGAEERTYESVNAAGFGTHATVRGLRTIGRQNSPSVENPKWNILTKRLFRAGAASYYYVRGHLINGTFGGPGNDWRNLTPLTQTANNRSIASMLSTFENPVRDAVRAGGSADMVVRAISGSRGRASVAAQVRNSASALSGARSDAERADIADVIAAEESVPMAIDASATIHRSGAPDRRLASRTENVIDTDLSHYYHRDHPPGSGAMARREINLSAADSSTLAALTGVNQALAERIIAARGPSARYRDRDDFIAKLRPDGTAVWHQLSSTAGVRLVF